MQRNPAVAGQFYSDSPTRLLSDLASMIPETNEKTKVSGGIAPHAGYVYSGPGAGKLYSGIEIPETVLIIGPNHHGEGSPLALYPDGSWSTPLGTTLINSSLNALLSDSVPYIQYDTRAHLREHSLEVQLPFLQYLQPELSFSALCVGHSNVFSIIHDIGIGIAHAIRAVGHDVLIIASSDMTHYESAVSAREKDSLALDAVLTLDPEKLMQVCRASNITMCGVIPAAIMLVACCELGSRNAHLVSYSTSGDVTGDNRQVVGYASVEVW